MTASNTNATLQESIQRQRDILKGWLSASLVRINAYNQPGVEAGKKAAAAVLELQRGLIAELRIRVQAHVMRLPIGYFDSTKSGS